MSEKKMAVNILLIGDEKSGKTTLINSLLLHTDSQLLFHNERFARRRIDLTLNEVKFEIMIWEPLRLIQRQWFANSVNMVKGSIKPDIVIVCVRRDTLINYQMAYEKWTNLSQAAYRNTPILLLTTYKYAIPKSRLSVPHFWLPRRDCLYARSFGAKSHREVDVTSTSSCIDAFQEAIAIVQKVNQVQPMC